jgi:hypothetical protein
MNISETLKALSGFVGEDSWVLQVFVVVFVTLLFNYLQRRTLNKLHIQIEKTSTYWDDAVVIALKKPLALLIWIVGLAFAIDIIRRDAGAVIFDAIDLRDSGVIATLAWFLVSFITQAEVNIIAQKEARGESYGGSGRLPDLHGTRPRRIVDAAGNRGERRQGTEAVGALSLLPRLFQFQVDISPIRGGQ